MDSTTRKLPQIRSISSPTPVAPAAPASSSTYKPEPIIGESPTRPWSLWARPEVEQHPPRVLLLPRASTVTVSWLSPPPGTAMGWEGFGLVAYHSLTLASVESCSKRKPFCRAKSLAPSPTRMTWGVLRATKRANRAGWRIFSIPATDPQSMVFPSITQASRVTTPKESATPP